MIGSPMNEPCWSTLPCSTCTTTSAATASRATTVGGDARGCRPRGRRTCRRSTSSTDTAGQATRTCSFHAASALADGAAVGQRGPAARRGRLVQVGDVVAHHPRRGDERAERLPVVLHLVDPADRHAVALGVEQRHDLPLEQAEQARRLAGVAAARSPGRRRPRGSPSRSRRRSTRPTSRRGCCSSATPLSAAFIPLVPHASSGRRGLFSHTSQPWYIVRATAMS